MPPAGEDELVAWLRGLLGTRSAELIGDDAARLELSGSWAITVDSQIAGIHYPAGIPTSVVGRRLLAVNLSDLAAVGAEPGLAVVAVAAPSGWDHEGFFRGLAAGCERFGVTLAGGDLASSPTPTATLTALGRLPAGHRWLRRDAARPGDRLWLGGTVAESAVGRRLLAAGATIGEDGVDLAALSSLDGELLAAATAAVERHLLPTPQLALGAWLGTLERAAAIDLSDGLSRDLHRMLRASGVAAEIDAARLPVPDAVAALATHLGDDPLELALAGGEDYVLLFAIPPEDRPPRHFGCVEIGLVTEGEGLRLLVSNGPRDIPPRGWDHLSTTEG